MRFKFLSQNKRELNEIITNVAVPLAFLSDEFKVTNSNCLKKQVEGLVLKASEN